MKKYYCDICNKLLTNPDKTKSIQIKSNDSMFIRTKYDEVCDECMTDLTLAMNIKIAEIRSKGDKQ